MNTHSSKTQPDTNGSIFRKIGDETRDISIYILGDICLAGNVARIGNAEEIDGVRVMGYTACV